MDYTTDGSGLEIKNRTWLVYTMVNLLIASYQNSMELVLKHALEYVCHSKKK